MISKKEIRYKLDKSMSIGIISGAGPMAGIQLMTAIINKCQKNGAYHDRDFPKIQLLNIPFSEMLEEPIDGNKITKEIQAGFETLKNCTHIVMACQTAHLFLPKEIPVSFINLFDLVKNRLSVNCKPIVIASRTSVKNKLHNKLLGVECDYYDAEKSQVFIDAILRGEHVSLSWINELDKRRPIILGCTEYSIPQAGMRFNFNIIDPIDISARVLVNSFIQKETSLMKGIRSPIMPNRNINTEVVYCDTEVALKM